jgi:hypothetical protein
MSVTWLKSKDDTISPREFQLAFKISNDNFVLLGITVGMFHSSCAAVNKFYMFFFFQTRFIFSG